MRSSIVSMLIAILVIGGVILGGFLLYKKFSASADTVTQSSCVKSDINKDSKVNSLDLNLLIKAVAQKSTDLTKYDINSDKAIDDADIQSLKSCWSRAASSTI